MFLNLTQWRRKREKNVILTKEDGENCELVTVKEGAQVRKQTKAWQTKLFCNQPLFGGSVTGSDVVRIESAQNDNK